MPAISLFLFAHQDDEFAVLQRITNAVADGHRVCCAYMTTGGFSGMAFEHRNKESLAVLSKLQVHPKDVFFVGQSLNIPDASLPSHMDAGVGWLRGWLATNPGVVALYVPAWEGGHHDHDAVHAIGVVAGQCFGLECATAQFPLYNGFKCMGPLFRVLLPLPANGPVETVRIPWRNRIRFLRYCLSYPSQAKTWFGLFPFVFFHYVLNGQECVQPISKTRLLVKPHDGPLYYERRGFYVWEKFSHQIASLLARY
jgi:LmbE family N-acetylglucosaminyl deacetylase